MKRVLHITIIVSCLIAMYSCENKKEDNVTDYSYDYYPTDMDTSTQATVVSAPVDTSEVITPEVTAPQPQLIYDKPDKRSKAYRRGYNKGYEDGEEDGSARNGYMSSFDDANRYSGSDATDYEAGYEEGYDDGYEMSVEPLNDNESEDEMWDD